MFMKSARFLVIAVIVMVASVMAWSIAAAQQDATAEPTATVEANATAEAATPEVAQDKPFLGVALQDSDNGVAIAQVVDGSAAANAGLQVGDVITALNGTDVKTAAEVAKIVKALKPGDSLTIAYTRGSDSLTATATLGTQPATLPSFGDQRPGRPSGDMGITYNGADQTWTIDSLVDSSPLYAAGLRQGDVIKTVDGKSYDPMSLQMYLRSLAADAKVTLGIERDGAAQDVQISLSDLRGLFGPMAILRGFGGNGNNPQGNGQQGNNPMGGMLQMMPFMYGNGRLGVTFVTIDDQVAKEHNLTVTDGALITAVDANSPASDAGLKVDDVITAVDGDKVDQERTLRDRMIAYEPGDEVTLTVLRAGASQDIKVTLGQQQMPSDGMPFGFQFNMPDGMIPFGGPNGAPGQMMPDATPEATPNA